MKRLSLFALAILLGSISSAWATMSEYQFTQTTGTATDMSGATEALPSDRDDYTAGSYNIGFTFDFDGTEYTTFSVSSNGWMKLGAHTTNSDLSNAFDGGAQYPVLSALWDDLETYASDGYVRFKTTGTAPNRVLTVEWRTMYWTNTGGPWVYQVRLYETTNAIEFFYIDMPGNGGVSATIGAATSSTNFASITPGSPATVSYTTANNSIDIDVTTIAANTLYRLVKCELNISISGTPSEGGTTVMADGDSLIVDQETPVGESRAFMPYTIALGVNNNACAPRSYTYSLTGAFAAEYAITPTSGKIGDGESYTPVLTFTPRGIGTRAATLTVRDDNGFSRSYSLLAVGVPRIAWIGNVLQGGTPELLDGDVLMRDIEVNRNNTGNFTPITIKNNGTSKTAPPAQITYTLIDPSGQYSINTTNASLSSGQSSIPVITFSPKFTGEQRATLRVNADGEVRTFSLAGYAVGPSAEFFVDGNVTTTGSSFFNKTILCVGDIVTLPVTIRNTNRVDVEINSVNVFATESAIRQGAPRYPIQRDASGNRLHSIDYVFTEQPGVVPFLKNQQPSLPVTIAPGESKTFYLSYLPIYPSSRYARIFVRTNAENFVGAEIGSFDQNGTLVEVDGLFSLDLFGKAVGSNLAGANNANLPEPITFKSAEIRDQQLAKTWVQNDGECDLLISKSELRVDVGDVTEFKIVSAFTNTTVAGDNYVLAPGQGDSIVVAFTPITFGSRRASIRLVTNDSTLLIPGVTERGTHYLDLYGVGKVGLEVRNLSLNPAVIGGASSSGKMMLENTSGGTVEVIGIEVEGGNGEIIADASNPWPSLPFVIIPGQQVELGFVMVITDATALPGVREARVRIALNNGDTAIATVSGYAGTRTIAVSPGSAFTNSKVAVGELARTFIILSNTGTLPARLDDPVVTGANKDDYVVSPLRRRVIEPGQVEVFEVTYIPQAVGMSTAQLEFGSNAVNGVQVVTLGGEATGTIKVDDPNGASGTEATPGVDLGRATATESTNQLAFRSVAPNPVRGLTDITFAVAQEGTVELALYDASGALVKVLNQGEYGEGDHTFRVDFTGLSSGTYYCALRQGDRLVTRTVTVVR